MYLVSIHKIPRQVKNLSCVGWVSIVIGEFMDRFLVTPLNKGAHQNKVGGTALKVFRNYHPDLLPFSPRKWAVFVYIQAWNRATTRVAPAYI